MILLVCFYMHGCINPSIQSTLRVPMDLRPLPLTLSIDCNQAITVVKTCSVTEVRKDLRFASGDFMESSHTFVTATNW